MSITPKSKKYLTILGAVIAVVILFFGWRGGYFDNTKVTESTTVSLIDSNGVELKNNLNKVSELPLPSKSPSSEKGLLVVRQGQMQWESQFAWLLATGGPTTTKGSLMEQAGIKLTITRQDNCMAGIADIVKCATDYKSNKNTTEGLHMYNVMGDGVGSFLANLTPQLASLGSDYRPVVIPYFAGKSYGADAVWIPRTWVESTDDGKFSIIKDSLRGCVVSTVAKDGDWNVLVNLSSITQVPMNWNIGTYDPNAINVHNVSDYQLAADAAIADKGRGLLENFTLKKGTGLGGKKEVRVRAFSSWSPEDKQAAEEVGGFVRILSTREYDGQMGCATITFKKFVDDNRDKVIDMILATAQAADQIKSYRSSMKKAAEIAVDVYGNQDVQYFLDMYNGDVVTDATGEKVEVGGNRVMNLADNMDMWGLSEGSTNVYQEVYKTYANIIAKNYPEDMPQGPVPFNKVADISILQDAYDKSQSGGKEFISKADASDFSKDKKIKTVVGQANYQINFATGQATFLPGTEEVLQSILSQATIASNTLIQINGYTDNVGDDASNVELSNRRAKAVSDWLKQKAPTKFTGHRVSTQGYGKENAIASNNTESGRKLNRRVEILIGANE